MWSVQKCTLTGTRRLIPSLHFWNFQSLLYSVHSTRVQKTPLLLALRARTFPSCSGTMDKFFSDLNFWVLKPKKSHSVVMYVYLTPQNVIWSSGEGKLRLLKACLSSAGTQVSSPCFTLTHLASASPHFHLFALFALLCFVWMEPCAFGPEPHSQPLSSHFEIAFLGSSCFLHVLPGVVSESDCTWDKCSSNIVDGLFDPGYKLDSSSLSFGSSGAWL